MSVDDKLDLLLSRFDKLESRFDKLESRFDKLERQLNTYIKSEADIVESDIRQNIRKYFDAQYGPGRLIRYDDQLKKISKPYSNDTLTEFDGLFVLTIPGIPRVSTRGDRKFVLIEAKRHATLAHVRTKMKQYEGLQEAIRHAKAKPAAHAAKPLARKYLATLQAHKFAETSGILLYIGGRFWDDDALEAMKAHVAASPDIGYATASCASYDVVDGKHILLPSAGGGVSVRKNTARIK